MAKQNLTGRLKSAFKPWREQDLAQSYDLYNQMRAQHDLGPTKRLSSTLAKPNSTDANVKLRKTAHLKKVAVSGRAIAQGDSSGIEVCPWRTQACTVACLGGEGNYLYPRNQRVKIARAQFEYHYPHHAWTIYAHEIEKDYAYAARHGWQLFWRPDIISDSQVWSAAPEIFSMFPNVTFYGYTKNWAGVWRAPLGGWVLPNYRIAFSASELDLDIDRLTRQTLVNVAVVFKVKSADELPARYLGIPVVNAIDDDTWMLQHDGVIGGLKPIGQKMTSDCSGFVREPQPVHITTKQLEVAP